MLAVLKNKAEGLSPKALKILRVPTSLPSSFLLHLSILTRQSISPSSHSLKRLFSSATFSNSLFRRSFRANSASFLNLYFFCNLTSCLTHLSTSSVLSTSSLTSIDLNLKFPFLVMSGFLILTPTCVKPALKIQMSVRGCSLKDTDSIGTNSLCSQVPCSSPPYSFSLLDPPKQLSIVCFGKFSIYPTCSAQQHQSRLFLKRASLMRFTSLLPTRSPSFTVMLPTTFSQGLSQVTTRVRRLGQKYVSLGLLCSRLAFGRSPSSGLYINLDLLQQLCKVLFGLPLPLLLEIPLLLGLLLQPDLYFLVPPFHLHHLRCHLLRLVVVGGELCVGRCRRPVLIREASIRDHRLNLALIDSSPGEHLLGVLLWLMGGVVRVREVIEVRTHNK